MTGLPLTISFRFVTLLPGTQTMFGHDILERIGKLKTDTCVLGLCDVKKTIISVDNSKCFDALTIVISLTHLNYLDIMRTFLSYIKDQTLHKIKIKSLGNLRQRTIQLSDFCRNSLVPIPKRKRSTWRRPNPPLGEWYSFNYTRCSRWHCGLGCHFPMTDTIGADAQAPRVAKPSSCSHNNNFFCGRRTTCQISLPTNDVKFKYVFTFFSLKASRINFNIIN